MERLPCREVCELGEMVKKQMGPFGQAKKTPLRFVLNALAFEVKHKCVCVETQVRLKENSLAFKGKCSCVCGVLKMTVSLKIHS